MKVNFKPPKSRLFVIGGGYGGAPENKMQLFKRLRELQEVRYTKSKHTPSKPVYNLIPLKYV